MKSFLIAVMIVVMSALAPSLAGAGLRGRYSYGPVILNAGSNACFPTAAGLDTSNFDGDMTITSYFKGSGSITWTVEVTNFTAAEDPSNGSFVSVTPTPHSATQIADTIKGPVERMRFCVSAFSTGTTWVKVTGRIAP